MTILVFAVPHLLALAAGLLLGAAAAIVWLRRRRTRPTSRRILLALPGGGLAAEAVDATARLARAEHATVVPTVILPAPRRFALDAARPEAASPALELLEAVERRLRRAGVQVDARIVQGRTTRHGLRRVAEQVRYDRMVVPAGEDRGGFSAADVGWLLANVPGEVLVLRPGEAPGPPPPARR